MNNALNGQNEDIQSLIIEKVADSIIAGKLNSVLNEMLAISSQKQEMKKQELDSIRAECKQTMHTFVYHLVSSVCLNDSDNWFQILDNRSPLEGDLELFLDMVEKSDEVVSELQKGFDFSTEPVIKLIKELGLMLYKSKPKIKNELAMLV